MKILSVIGVIGFVGFVFLLNWVLKRFPSLLRETDEEWSDRQW